MSSFFLKRKIEECLILMKYLKPPYIVRESKESRITGIVLYQCFVIILFLVGYSQWVTFWQDGSHGYKIGLFIILALVCKGTLDTIFCMTTFSNIGIEHRNWYLKTITKPYSEVELLIEAPSSHNLKIIFNDGKKISITNREDALIKVIEILREQIPHEFKIKCE